MKFNKGSDSFLSQKGFAVIKRATKPHIQVLFRTKYSQSVLQRAKNSVSHWTAVIWNIQQCEITFLHQGMFDFQEEKQPRGIHTEVFLCVFIQKRKQRGKKKNSQHLNPLIKPLPSFLPSLPPSLSWRPVNESVLPGNAPLTQTPQPRSGVSREQVRSACKHCESS